ncbi:LysM peptidoglycan-binding domain-containing protein [Brachybacterium alimentarium]|uniref:LysM peptidoglycan-binding domain-containing protein n=1 Tax=Brachybacterium alimentarium TaxID=47845 RepID=UPI000DF2E5DF|nr:LysM peptidoglycan-binding domain-containing protein [Brachybacterium alimentarium]RCS76046.1 LysM peptidoglycan-binding domain-containing protein [Brachybacterium alimentarium]RCS85793.1 LysM peptidoglycan-binding domain-containing protein [Brachybacterium alimentarium]
MHTETATVLPFSQHRDERAAQSDRPGVRLKATRRGRVVLTALAFLLGLLVAAALLLMFEVPSALAGGGAEEPVTLTVEAGDTLWGYADEFAPDGMSEQEFVSEVRSLNHLTTPRVTAGQLIELPALEGASH